MTAVLQKLSLVAYRGIADLTLDGLTPVSLIVGANNAGKSSIMEAAGLALRSQDHGQWVSAVRQRDADMNLADGVWSMFPGSGALQLDDTPQQPLRITIDALLSGSPRRMEIMASAMRTPDHDEETALTVMLNMRVDGGQDFYLYFPAPKGVRPQQQQVVSYRAFTVTPASHYSTNIFVEQLSQVVDAGRKQLAIQLLKIFDPGVLDLDVIASFGRKAVRVTHVVRGVGDLSSFGDGMRRSALLALALTRASQGVLLVDEIETGIHHSVLRQVLSKLLEAAAASQVQILATTHSLEAVDALIGAVEDRGTPDALSAYWVQRQAAKHEVRRYDFAKLCTLREGGLDLR